MILAGLAAVSLTKSGFSSYTHLFFFLPPSRYAAPELFSYMWMKFWFNRQTQKSVGWIFLYFALHFQRLLLHAKVYFISSLRFTSTQSKTIWRLSVTDVYTPRTDDNISARLYAWYQ